MVASSINDTLRHLRVEKEIFIAAPIEIAFEATLEEMGSENSLPDGTPMPMVLEAWPGGRWFRDLGNHSGHFWGYVQVIKPPKLLELSGPMFMSYPCINHIQYRFIAEEMGTKLVFRHRAFADFPDDHRDSVGIGWSHILKQIKANAESR